MYYESELHAQLIPIQIQAKPRGILLTMCEALICS